jgi:hypothetical protein
MVNALKEWWARMVAAEPVPAYVLVRPAHARRCPECSSAYAASDRYCPGCYMAVPEWRFG